MSINLYYRIKIIYEWKKVANTHFYQYNARQTL